MNLIRSDYLKEVAVGAVFFGCVKTREERAGELKGNTKAYAGEGLGVTVGGGVSCDNGPTHHRARNPQL